MQMGGNGRFFGFLKENDEDEKSNSETNVTIKEKTGGFPNDKDAGREIFEFLMEDGEDDVISDDVNSDDFDSLYGSLKKKFDEFVQEDYSEQSDIAKIEEFLKSIRHEYSLLRQNFGDNVEFQILSDRIAREVKGNYVKIVNYADSFEVFDFDILIMVFKELLYMSYTPLVKEEVENNIEQLESIRESHGL